MFSNNHFQFLNNISHILIQFLTYTYFTNIFKQQLSAFKDTSTKASRFDNKDNNLMLTYSE